MLSDSCFRPYLQIGASSLVLACSHFHVCCAVFSLHHTRATEPSSCLQSDPRSLPVSSYHPCPFLLAVEAPLPHPKMAITVLISKQSCFPQKPQVVPQPLRAKALITTPTAPQSDLASATSPTSFLTILNHLFCHGHKMPVCFQFPLSP